MWLKIVLVGDSRDANRAWKNIRPYQPFIMRKSRILHTEVTETLVWRSVLQTMRQHLQQWFLYQNRMNWITWIIVDKSVCEGGGSRCFVILVCTRLSGGTYCKTVLFLDTTKFFRPYTHITGPLRSAHTWKWFRLIKMCLEETYSKAFVGNSFVSCTFCSE